MADRTSQPEGEAPGRRSADLMDIAVDRQGEHALVAPSGEIDEATTPRLATILDELTQETKTRRITVDLRGVTFLDSAGLQLLFRMATAAGRDGYDFEVARVPHNIRRLFVMAGVDQIVHMAER